MIKAVFIDIDNTILSFDDYVKTAMREGFEKFSVAEYTDDMFDTFTRVNNSLWQALERKELSFTELKERRWNDIFSSLGINYDGQKFEDFFRESIYSSAIEIPGAFDLVHYLSEKYILCAASNGPYEQQKHRLAIAGIIDCFDHIFISEDIGASKPDKKFFSATFERLNRSANERIEPCDCVMIGDSLTSDMEGGIAYGMKTVFFNLHSKDTSGIKGIDHSVNKLEDIKKIL